MKEEISNYLEQFEDRYQELEKEDDDDLHIEFIKFIAEGLKINYDEEEIFDEYQRCYHPQLHYTYSQSKKKEPELSKIDYYCEVIISMLSIYA